MSSIIIPSILLPNSAIFLSNSRSSFSAFSNSFSNEISDISAPRPSAIAISVVIGVVTNVASPAKAVKAYFSIICYNDVVAYIS